MLRAVFNHLLRKLIIHIRLNTSSGFLFLFSLLAKDLGLDRTSSGESLAHRLRLEPDSCFGEYRGEHTTSPLPRICTFLVFEPEHIQTFDKRISPVFATISVGINHTNNLVCQLTQSTLFHILGKIGVKLVVFAGLLSGDQRYLNAAVIERYPLRVNDLYLKPALKEFVILFETHRGSV